jgi:hypothetical protein
MGAAQGVLTIVRGAVPLELFGAQGYGAVLGLLATPVIVVNAAAPTAFAFIVEAWGRGAAEAILVACATAAWLCMEVMARWVRRNRNRRTAAPM